MLLLHTKVILLGPKRYSKRSGSHPGELRNLGQDLGISQLDLELS